MSSGTGTVRNWLRLISYSAVGVFAFFVPFGWNGKNTILLDHIVVFLSTQFRVASIAYVLLMCFFSAAYDFRSGNWNRNPLNRVMAALKILGALLAVMTVFEIGPSFLLRPDVLPFLFYKVVMLIAIIIPIGAIFLPLLVEYGLMDFVGVLLQPIMRPIWKIPGKSAVDAAASFAGSYSVGLLITNRMYKTGGYSAKEAAIIATGFSSVSAAFMVIVARTLGLTDIWNVFFWVTLTVTFIVTAVVVRMPPLSSFPNSYARARPGAGTIDDRFMIKRAANAAVQCSANASPVVRSTHDSVRGGVRMVLTVAPIVMSVGTLALLAVKFTPIFEFFGYLFYPLTLLLGIPDAKEVANAVSASLPDMFIPALMSVDISSVSRLIVGVVSISSIIFFDGSIPCILATDIPITVRQLLLIWIQRTIVSLIVVTPVAFGVEYWLRG